jgi:SWI/SNF-related matrix-associated actin-dependent regulator 1 of chromatin subfamily A
MSRAAHCAAEGRPLRDYQYDGVKFLAGRKYALIADDMGLGKTIQALVALPPNAATIVVCPHSLKWNWHDECLKWRPDLTPIVCTGRKGKKAFRVPAEGELIIINYDILPAYLKPVPKLDDAGKEVLNRKGKVVKEAVVPADVEAALAKTIGIFDECQKAKNYKAQRSQKVTELCSRLAGVWGATGTPLMNRPFDLWGVLSSLGLNWKVFGSWPTFLRCFGGYHSGFGYEFSSVSGPETAERLRRVMLRRLKADVLKDLPAKQYQTLRINGMSKEIYKELDRLQKVWGETLGAKKLPPFEAFSEIRAKLAAARIPAMIEHVESFEDAGEPLVVFSAHRAPVDTLGKREGWATITGDTSAAKRRDVVRSFQAGELKGIALTIAAGGEGLTLTRASNMLKVDLDWTPSMNTQAEDRLHRIGQTNAVNIVRMVSDHDLDRHVTDLLIEKSAVIAQAVDGVATDIELSKAPAPSPAIEIVEEDEAAWDARTALQRAAVAKDAALEATELVELRSRPVDVADLLAMDCPF